jgi:hypothetical protein
MTMEKINQDFYYDSRISLRNIRAGRVNKADFEKYIEALPDLKDQSEELGPDVYGSERSRLAVTGEYSSSDDHDHDHDDDSL